MDPTLDYLVIGAGPAGLQLAYYLEQHGRDYLVLERGNSPGQFFRSFPRHRMLISINKVHTGNDDPEANLRWDWNSLLGDEPALRFSRYSAQYYPDPDDLLCYLADFAERHQLKIQSRTEVARVSRPNGTFVVTDQDGRHYRARQVIIATGLFKPFTPDFPGADLCEQYNTHDTDLARFVNKRVLVVGKGNSAFETANHLNDVAAAIHICSPHSVKLAWQTHYVGNLRAVNNDFLDTYQLKAQNTVIDGTITRVEPEGDRLNVHIAYSHAQGQTTVRPYDHVILCTGFRFDDSIFDGSCRPALTVNDRFPDQTTEWESVNVPDLYIAGTLMQACDYRKTMSGFIHGFRHNIHALSTILEAKYHGQDWPCDRLSATTQPVLDRIVRRLNSGPGIFLQPGFLRDVVVIDDDAGEARYYEDVRADHVPQCFLGANRHYYTISLEYGTFTDDPFSVERDPSPSKANEAAYLHPVIRRYDGQTLIAEHHVQDDLESEWWREEYVAPARAWLETQLADRPRAHETASQASAAGRRDTLAVSPVRVHPIIRADRSAGGSIASAASRTASGAPGGTLGNQ
jgi:thioredoxin reductase